MITASSFILIMRRCVRACVGRKAEGEFPGGRVRKGRRYILISSSIEGGNAWAAWRTVPADAASAQRAMRTPVRRPDEFSCALAIRRFPTNERGMCKTVRDERTNERTDGQSDASLRSTVRPFVHLPLCPLWGERTAMLHRNLRRGVKIR